MQSRVTASVLVLATAAALAACSDSDNPVATPIANTTVRFFNATSALALDVAQNGTGTQRKRQHPIRHSKYVHEGERRGPAALDTGGRDARPI